MTSFRFQKWEATGNDFVVVNLEQSGLQANSFQANLARAVCDRKSGVGADGVVLLDLKSTTPGVEIWNADGSRAEMCGNALRCVCLALTQHPQVSAPYRMQIDKRLVEGRPGEGHATISMGPVSPEQDYPLFHSLVSFDQLLGQTGYLASFGNPHYVVPCTEIPPDWQSLGSALQPLADEELGTGGINLGFVELEERDGVRQLRVFERGVGFTQSCGSGACAASAVLEARCQIAAPHRFELPGGVLDIGRQEQQFLLGGPARMEFEGRWPR